MAGSTDDWDYEVMTDLMESIEDPIIREQAALLSTKNRFTSVPTRLLDAIASIQSSEPTDALRLAAWGLRKALFTEDHERMAMFADRMKRTLDQECTVPEPHPWLMCDQRAYELRDAHSRLVALGLQSPNTWQEALTAEAWKCHLDTPHEGTSRTEAVWNGEFWNFGEWDAPTTVTDCLDDIQVTELVPDEPTTVRLTVERTTP